MLLLKRFEKLLKFYNLGDKTFETDFGVDKAQSWLEQEVTFDNSDLAPYTLLII